MIAPGQILMKIEDPTKMIIKTSLNEKEVNSVSVGDNVTIESNDKSVQGKISSISPTLNEITKKVDVEIEILRTDNKLTAESLVDIHFFPKANGSIFIPLNSLLQEDEQNFVRIVTGKNRIQKLPVTIGEIVGTYVKIKSGLQGIEQIVKAGTNFYEENEKVKV